MASSAIYGKKIPKRLPCNLTLSEVEERANRCAQLTTQYEEIEAEAKDISAGYKERLKDLRALKSEMAKQVNTGQEERLVDCIEHLEFMRGVVVLRRTDTYDAVSEREMTYEEKQLNLPLEYEESNAPTDKVVYSDGTTVIRTSR